MFIYLASPYSVPEDGKYSLGSVSNAASPELKHERFVKACKIAAELMAYGHQVFSPIAHSHSVELYGMNGHVYPGDFWLKQDFAILKAVDAMYIYQLKGWEHSKGIREEINFCIAHNIPVFFLETSGKVVPYGTQDRLVA